MGLTVEETPARLFTFDDPEYPIVVTARAVKSLPPDIAFPWKAAVKHPDITVIIPMYNAESTIRDTLLSVASQNYESYEILIVNDGSTDNSYGVASEIAATAKGRITMLEHPKGVNLGLALSRNLAISHSRGEFLVFLDADDTIHPQKFAHNIAILREFKEAAALVGPTLWWWDDTDQKDAHLDVIVEPADRVVFPPEFFEAVYSNQAAWPPCVHSWMVRKSILNSMESFDPYVLTYEDQKFLGELSLRFPIYVTSACLSNYRRRERTLWANAILEGTDQLARARFLEWKESAICTSSRFQQELSGRFFT